MQRTPDGQRYSNALFGLAALHTQTLVSLLGEFVFFFLSLSLSTSSSVQSAAVRGGLLPVRFVRALSSLFFSLNLFSFLRCRHDERGILMLLLGFS